MSGFIRFQLSDSHRRCPRQAGAALEDYEKRLADSQIIKMDLIAVFVFQTVSKHFQAFPIKFSNAGNFKDLIAKWCHADCPFLVFCSSMDKGVKRNRGHFGQSRFITTGAGGKAFHHLAAIYAGLVAIGQNSFWGNCPCQKKIPDRKIRSRISLFYPQMEKQGTTPSTQPLPIMFRQVF